MDIGNNLKKSLLEARSLCNSTIRTISSTVGFRQLGEVYGVCSRVVLTVKHNDRAYLILVDRRRH